VNSTASGWAESIGERDSATFGWKGLSGDEVIEIELAGTTKSRANGGVDESELFGCADACAFEKAKAGSIGD
jgi:hypothetical protein